MTITLITGANKGLGYETARQLIGRGHTVYLGSRDPDRGKRAAADLGAELLLLDVTSDTSAAAAAARVRDEAGHLDVLVNNAGIPGGFRPAGETTAADLEAVYGTNVFGVVRVTHAFLPLLLLSEAPVIVNVSSGLGSLAVTNNPDRLESTLKGLAYPSSKSALNMLTSQYAKSYPQVRVNAVDPGYTATDLNSHRGTQTIEQGAEIIVAMATAAPTGPTGTFADRHGPVPW
jgi:NAD(P)-dependent dehydrogenase (short-subunit alcohol dehydrogenase family)